MSVNTDFLNDQKYVGAYNCGFSSLNLVPSEMRYKFIYDHWRVYTACQLAKHAALKSGDFVECGVNTGFLMKAVMSYVDFKDLKKVFYCFDTWSGVPLGQLSEKEVSIGRNTVNDGYYDVDFFDAFISTLENREYVVCTRGVVPESLKSVEIEQVSFLSIDMNCAYPEVEALKYFWPKIVPGGVVLLDDYGFRGYEVQKEAMDQLGCTLGFRVLTLPSGQGLIIK